MHLYNFSIAREVDGVGYCGVEVIGNVVVLVAVAVEQCLVVGIQALSEERSKTSTVSSPKHMRRGANFVQ